MVAEDMWTQVTELRRRDERRSGAPDPAKELLLVTKVSEEANEAAERYRGMHGWGTDGPTTSTLPEGPGRALRDHHGRHGRAGQHLTGRQCRRTLGAVPRLRIPAAKMENAAQS